MPEAVTGSKVDIHTAAHVLFLDFMFNILSALTKTCKA